MTATPAPWSASGGDRSATRLLPFLGFAMLTVLAAAAGIVVGSVATGDSPVVALLFPLVLLPVALWRRPGLGVLLVFAGTIVIEQFDYVVGPRSGAVTARVPLFHSVVPGTGVTPVEILLVLVVAVWMLRTAQERGQLLYRTALTRQILVLASVTVLYLLVGIARGGDVRMALWEARPFLYLSVAYVLASATLANRSAIRCLLWLLVLGSGVKAVYGAVIWFSIRHLEPRPEAVLAHEESFFFGVFLFVTLGLWLFRVRGRLRVVATLFAPVVLFADMCNSRRTAWAILFAGLAVMVAFAYQRVPQSRAGIRRALVALTIVSAVYVPVYWNHDGALAQPARAVRSVIAPDARDEQSNRYRYVEDTNLLINIQQRHSTGTGFGHVIDYAVAIVDLSSTNSGIAYIPHNGILYVWMRMGVLGEAAFWLLIFQAMMAAGRLTRAVDRQTAMFGAVTACAVVAYVIMGYKDMGLSWFRLAFCVGTLLGLVEAQTRMVGSPVPGSQARLRPWESRTRTRLVRTPVSDGSRLRDRQLQEVR